MTKHQIQNHNWYMANKKRLNKKSADYNKTFRGKIVRMYLNAQQRVRGQDKKRPKYKGLPICSISDFYLFVNYESNYEELFRNWRDANYSLRLTPTIDRLDKTKGYTLDNIEIVTLSENVKRRGGHRALRRRSQRKRIDRRSEESEL